MIKLGEYVPSDYTKSSPDEVWDIYLDLAFEPSSYYHNVIVYEAEPSSYTQSGPNYIYLFYTNDVEVASTEGILKMDRNDGGSLVTLSESGAYRWKSVTSTNGNKYYYLMIGRPSVVALAQSWDVNPEQYVGSSYTNSYINSNILNIPNPSADENYKLEGIDFLESLYSPEGIDLGDPYIKFTSAGNISFQFSYLTGTYQYSEDNINWNNISTSGSTYTCGNTVYMRGTGGELSNHLNDDIGNFHFYILNSTAGADIECSGNMEAMVNYTKVANNEHANLGFGTFKYAFGGCTNLKYAHNLTLGNVQLYRIDTSSSGQTYASYWGECYRSMFQSCTNLVTIPQMPAKYLCANCYLSMFEGCASLTDLSSLTLEGRIVYQPPLQVQYENASIGCYEQMFENCTSLQYLPTLPMTVLAKRCYWDMFWGCSSLVDASNFTLPATTLGIGSYFGMFGQCTSLEDASFELPAETIVGAYERMFYGCSSLVNPPTIRVKTVQNYIISTYTQRESYIGCLYMFYGCTSLVTAPELSSIVSIEKQGCEGMFQGCTSLKTVPSFPNISSVPDYGFSYMFANCTSLASIPNRLPITSLNFDSCMGMFMNCTSLERPPQLQENAILGKQCYWGMFQGCTSLKFLPFTKTSSTLQTGCYGHMFDGCTSLDSSSLQLPATTLVSTCYAYMFAGNNITTTHNLPATTVAESCYMGMYQGCSFLTTITSPLYATTTIHQCYAYMFKDCISLTTPPILPATTINGSCYRGMFEGCTSLTTMPNLPATNLSSGSLCYAEMFKGCIKLKKMKPLPATTLGNACYSEMFADCTKLEEATAILPATTPTYSCYKEMFKNCVSLTNAPEIMFTSYARYMMEQMFYNCISLSEPSKLHFTSAITSSNGSGMYLMYYGCSNIKVSESKIEHYRKPYIIPAEAIPTTPIVSTWKGMFVGTGGPFTGTPNLYQTYYLYDDSINYNLYVGVNGTAREVTAIYVGVNGKAREVTAMYVGVNGKAREV